MLKPIRTLFPAGHFYSPVCDPADLREQSGRIWPAGGRSAATNNNGIDFCIQSQLETLHRFGNLSRDIDFPIEEATAEGRYFYRNDQYPCLDAEVLYCFLRHLSPRRVVEVGSGFSSLITAEVNRRYFGGKINFSLIEPYPRQFLIDGVPGVTRLIQQKVQDVDLSVFGQLGEGDILFVDSSHVSKTGSDVNHLMFEVYPRLPVGTYVHIHDIFLPDDYPQKWAIEDGRNWNEQYLVQAFLQFNSAFEVVWASYLMCTRYAEDTAKAFPRFPQLGGGGSLWLRRRSL